MSFNLNEVRLIGHLGKDPEARYYPSGDMYVSAIIVTNKKVKNKENGEIKEYSEGHRVICGGKNAEFVSKYLKTGAYVYFQGELRHRSYESSQGETRWISEVVGRMSPLAKKAQGTPEAAAAAGAVGGMPDNVPVPPDFDEFEDDIPL